MKSLAADRVPSETRRTSPAGVTRSVASNFHWDNGKITFLKGEGMLRRIVSFSAVRGHEDFNYLKRKSVTLVPLLSVLVSFLTFDSLLQ